MILSLKEEFKFSTMGNDICSMIRATGSYIPERRVPNRKFLQNEFYDAGGVKLVLNNTEIIEKFKKISGIAERRYVTEDLVTSDIAYFAAKDALDSSMIDRESLDYIIVAHNFGDVRPDSTRGDQVPTIAARVKQKLGIINPKTIAYDLPFGCPGWLQGMIQANYYLKSGDAKKVLIIGAETLSRVSDPHDRDSMLYADGAGATILEGMKKGSAQGIIAHSTRSDTLEHAYMLWLDKTYHPGNGCNDLFLKMKGHHLYEYALKTVPTVVKESLDKAGLVIHDIKKILIHQANEKLDVAILKRLFSLYGVREIPDSIMPMTISELGNSSVATLPTLLDLLLKGRLDKHEAKKGDYLIFASLGAGMNINSLVYKMS
jgi:3-oxoacyl-[acyl-carrier-protein] synthase III